MSAANQAAAEVNFEVSDDFVACNQQTIQTAF